MTRSISLFEPLLPAPRTHIPHTPRGGDEGRFGAEFLRALMARDDTTPPTAAQDASARDAAKTKDKAPPPPSGVPTQPRSAGTLRLVPIVQGHVEVRGDLNPRNPFRAPLPNPPPDASVTGELKLGLRADLKPGTTASVYGRLASKGARSVQPSEYSVAAVGATLAVRLSPKTTVTAGYERLSVFGPPAPRGPADYKSHDFSVSVARPLTSKAAAPGRPSVDTTVAFVDRQANKPSENYRQERVIFDARMPLKGASGAPSLVGSFEVRRRDYTAGASKGRGDWFPVVASAGVQIPLGKSSCSATAFIEGTVQRSNRPGRDYSNGAVGVRFACRR
jgi:hypothetical protein